jgi:hypothetical protein
MQPFGKNPSSLQYKNIIFDSMAEEEGTSSYSMTVSSDLKA